MRKERILWNAWKYVARELTEAMIDLREYKAKIKEIRGRLNALISSSVGFEDKIDEIRREELYPALNRYRNIKARINLLDRNCREFKREWKDEVLRENGDHTL